MTKAQPTKWGGKPRSISGWLTVDAKRKSSLERDWHNSRQVAQAAAILTLTSSTIGTPPSTAPIRLLCSNAPKPRASKNGSKHNRKPTKAQPKQKPKKAKQRPPEKQVRTKTGRNAATAKGLSQHKKQDEGNAKMISKQLKQHSKTRTNWATSTRMKEAVEAFFKNKSTPQALSIVDHAVKFHIPRDTFYKYVHKDPKKQRRQEPLQILRAEQSTS